MRDPKAVKGWDWSSWQPIFRRRDALPEAQKLHARVGLGEAVKAPGRPALRDKTSILPPERVSPDGRTRDFRAHPGDGKALRHTFLALVECASDFVPDREPAESGNARSTVRPIERTCRTCGIFDRLQPDDSTSFAGHLAAGGAVRRFRNSKITMPGVKPLGICRHPGIALHFALPANPQAKPAGETGRRNRQGGPLPALARAIDDRPEFKGAHAGHAPGAAPDAGVVPVGPDAAKAVIAREAHRHNAEAGRRGQAMNGRS